MVRPAEEEKTAKRPETNKGGREEEEMRLGIATGTEPGRLRSTETGDGHAPAVVAIVGDESQ